MRFRGLELQSACGVDQNVWPRASLATTMREPHGLEVLLVACSLGPLWEGMPATRYFRIAAGAKIPASSKWFTVPSSDKRQAQRSGALFLALAAAANDSIVSSTER